MHFHILLTYNMLRSSMLQRRVNHSLNQRTDYIIPLEVLHKAISKRVDLIKQGDVMSIQSF